MNLDPMPPVRLLLTRVIVGEPLRRKAGIIQCTWLGEADERNPHVFEKPDRYYDITVVEVGV